VTCNDHSDDITNAVIEEIAAELRQPADQIPLDARLDAGELGIDSLGLIKLTVRLEERFDITMPDLTAQEAVAVASVRDVAALVARRIAVKGGAR
jgi:acyl carrier protein